VLSFLGRKFGVEYYEYKHFLDDLRILVKKIREKPDAIVAIARGGWVLGQMLSYALEVRNMCSVQCVSYDSGQQRKQVKIRDLPCLDSYRKVLLVDEIVDSGHTLKAVFDCLSSRYLQCQFKSASIFYKKDAIIHPDYTVKSTTEWIHFFWEVDIRKA
jgi:xanthine phosphoribosyltransferase